MSPSSAFVSTKCGASLAFEALSRSSKMQQRVIHGCLSRYRRIKSLRAVLTMLSSSTETAPSPPPDASPLPSLCCECVRACIPSSAVAPHTIDVSTPLRLSAKVRYRQSDQTCTLEQTDNGYRAVFEEPQRAVTPGQSVVFYDGEVCLGGGVIETAEPWFAGARP